MSNVFFQHILQYCLHTPGVTLRLLDLTDMVPCFQLTASAGGGSPVSGGAIGAVQAGQAAPGCELLQEVTGLLEAGMDVACFDLSQGLLEQHLDIADYLAEVRRSLLHMLTAFYTIVRDQHTSVTSEQVPGQQGLFLRP